MNTRQRRSYEDFDRFDDKDLSSFTNPAGRSRRFHRWLIAGAVVLLVAGVLAVVPPILRTDSNSARNEEPERPNSMVVLRLFETAEDPTPNEDNQQADPEIAPDTDVEAPPANQAGEHKASAPPSKQTATGVVVAKPEPDSNDSEPESTLPMDPRSAGEGATKAVASPGRSDNSDDHRPLPAGRFVRGSSEGGIESQPISLALLAPAIFAATVTQRSVARALDEFLPTSGPTGTSPVVSVPRQTLLPTLAAEGIGNAIESRAVDFRTNLHDPATSTAVVLVMKTPGDQAYWHEYAGCIRFHGWTLVELQAIRLDVQGTSAWFWYCAAEHPPSGCREHAIQFSVFVSDRRRELVLDSQWIAKQYGRHWRNPQRPFDNVLNYQIWSGSKECSLALARAVLDTLREKKNSWQYTFANQAEPAATVPEIFIAAAWIDGDDVCLAVTNRCDERRLVCFHGSKRLGRDDHQDIILPDQWHSADPDTSVVRLPLGPLHNAVVYAELDGWMDKVFVSTDVDHPRQRGRASTLHRAPLRAPSAVSGLSIAWPPDKARVPVLKDQIDLPGDKDDDYRVAVTGNAPADVPRGGQVVVDVGTDHFYRQKTVVVDGLWGCRAYLRGDEHTIRVQVLDSSGRVVAEQSVTGIRRREPNGKAAP